MGPVLDYYLSNIFPNDPLSVAFFFTWHELYANEVVWRDFSSFVVIFSPLK